MVRHRFAKPIFAGSIPAPASILKSPLTVVFLLYGSIRLKDRSPGGCGMRTLRNERSESRPGFERTGIVYHDVTISLGIRRRISTHWHRLNGAKSFPLTPLFFDSSIVNGFFIYRYITNLIGDSIVSSFLLRLSCRSLWLTFYSALFRVIKWKGVMVSGSFVQ